MMKSEFIERTGFEPTADEYEQIEQEYMGTDIDKDTFCKQWLKQGGIQRLSRMRARRIEELEAEVQQRTKEYDELDKARCNQIAVEQKKRKEEVSERENAIEVLKRNLEKTTGILADVEARADEAERKLAVIREAFEILTGKEVPV